GDRRGRLAELLLPALGRVRAGALDVVRRRLDLAVRRRVGQAGRPGEQDREGVLVELLAAPELLRARAADPADRAVAREGTRRIGRSVAGRRRRDVLVVPHELRHPLRLRRVAGGEQAGRLLVEVAAPDAVVAVVQAVAVREVAPRRRQAGDARAAVGLVLGGVER